MRAVLDLLQGEAVRVRAVAVAERAGAQREVEEPLGPALVVLLAQRRSVEALHHRQDVEEAVVDAGDVDLGHRLAEAGAGQPDQDLPLARAVGVDGEDRRRVLRAAADGELPDEVVVVRLLERREPGEDHVGVPGRLVDPVVDADHAGEPGQRGVEPVALGRREHRVAGHRDQRPDLALAGRADLLVQARHGDVAQHLGHAAHAAAPAAEVGRAAVEALHRQRADRPRGRSREHQPAGDVEVPGQDVDDVDQPAREGAELLVAQADPAVDDAALGRRRARGPAPGSARRRSRSRPATRSGVQSALAARRVSSPSTRSAIVPRSTRPSSKSTWTTAISSAASVPGVIGSHSSALSAVPVRRGSTTITRPPRLRMPRSRPSGPGTPAASPGTPTGWRP